MYGDCNIRIERTQNGFLVSMTDPAIVKKNDTRNKGDSCCAPWQDPNVKFSFEDKAGVVDFITKNLDRALPVDEYSSTFDSEVAKDSKK